MLDTRGAADDYLEPRFIREDGSEATVEDADACGYLHRAEGVEYTADQLAWVDEYIVATAMAEKSFAGPWPWLFGASFKTAAQLEEIERRLGRRLPLNARMKKVEEKP